MVVFATSHLEGDTQSWWVHLREEYWYMPPYNSNVNNILTGPWYRYPTWEEFCDLFCEQF